MPGRLTGQDLQCSQPLTGEAGFEHILHAFQQAHEPGQQAAVRGSYITRACQLFCVWRTHSQVGLESLVELLDEDTFISHQHLNGMHACYGHASTMVLLPADSTVLVLQSQLLNVLKAILIWGDCLRPGPSIALYQPLP